MLHNIIYEIGLFCGLLNDLITKDGFPSKTQTFAAAIRWKICYSNEHRACARHIASSVLKVFSYQLRHFSVIQLSLGIIYILYVSVSHPIIVL